MSGTEIVYHDRHLPMQCPILRSRITAITILRGVGTEGATRRSGRYHPPIVLRARYAMSGTERGYLLRLGPSLLLRRADDGRSALHWYCLRDVKRPVFGQGGVGLGTGYGVRRGGVRAGKRSGLRV
eukprot:2998974-Rhodomonas_salina.2